MEDIKLENGTTLERYNLIEGFYAGINNTYLVSGHLDFHDQNQIINLNRVNFGERIRDLIFDGEKLYLFLKYTAILCINKLS